MIAFGKVYRGYGSSVGWSQFGNRLIHWGACIACREGGREEGRDGVTSSAHGNCTLLSWN